MAMRTRPNSPKVAAPLPATPARPVGPARSAIRAALEGLVPSERRVAEHLLASADDILHRSVTEVALEAEASASTVVRACQRLGYKGFQDLKIHLAQDSLPRGHRMSADVPAGDGPAAVLASVLDGAQEALRLTTHTLDADAFATTVGWLAGARRILFAAVGTSSPLAQDAAYRFVTIGTQPEAPADVHVQHVRAALLSSDDVCVAISHTGATNETLATVSAARAAGARTVAITSFVRSPLTALADAVLVASSPETAYRVEAMSSRLAHLCVLDALVVATAIALQAEATQAQTITADILAEHRY